MSINAEEISDKEKNKEYTFNSDCFSTNFSNFSPMKILNLYFMSAECSDINRIEDYKVTFGHKLNISENKDIECKNSYSQISIGKKGYKLEKEIDCFIIFFDLEYNDSLSELNKILKILQVLSKNDLKLFIITFYTEEKEIKKKLNEDNIKNQLDRYGFNNFSLDKMNMDKPDEIIKTIDKITIETLQEKNLLNFDELEESKDKSFSICMIN